MIYNEYNHHFGFLLIMALIAALAGCSPAADATAIGQSQPMDTTMELASASQPQTPMIPTIDTAIPANLETASFGLG